jgi:hypothetical protein
VLVPFGDTAALARELIALLRDEPRRHAMRKKAYLLGREMVWSHVAYLYSASFHQAWRSRSNAPQKPLAIRTLEEQEADLPDWRLDHLKRMTDATGLFEHARHTIPNFVEGYCTDDNARALLLTVLLEELGLDSPEVYQLASTYAAFVNAAFVPARRRFRNGLSFDRHWQDEAGSDDCFGRALWALGACVSRSKRRDFQSWAMEVFEQSLPGIAETTSPRGWAFALLGIHEYFRRLSGDRRVAQARDTLVGRLLELHERVASDDWPWFEDVLSYDNAQLSHALIVSGHAVESPRARDVGLLSLEWLTGVQKSPHGHFRPIGSNSVYRRGEEPPQFDQQPLEAHATISACLAAYSVTDDDSWRREAHIAFDWFLGRNDLSLEVYDATTGGCRDGLHQDRVNQNQGAESSLAFLLSLAEMKRLEITLAAFRQVTDTSEG